jgi:hypothetical protein
MVPVLADQHFFQFIEYLLPLFISLHDPHQTTHRTVLESEGCGEAEALILTELDLAVS